MSSIKKAIFGILILSIIISTASLTYSILKKDISITIENQQESISTFKSTVSEVLQEKNISIGENDVINFDEKEKLKDGLEIIIIRAKKVNISMDNKIKVIMSIGPTIADVLKQVGINLGEKDIVIPKLTTIIKDDFNVKITKVTERTIYKKIQLAYGRVVVRDPKIEKGITKIVREGKTGLKELKINVTYADGKEVNRKTVAEVVLRKPLNSIFKEGTKNFVAISRGSSMNFSRAFFSRASAYWAGSCGKSKSNPGYGWTSMGVKVKKGIVAVDPHYIPYGTWLYIEGYGIALAADTGGDMRGNRIDLGFDNDFQCRSFGRRTVKVYILEKPRYNFK